MTNLIGLFVIPFLSSLALFILSSVSQRNCKLLAVGLSLLPLAILLHGYSDWMGAQIDYLWLPFLSIHFHLSVDGLSLVFLYLTAIVVPIVFFATPRNLLFPNSFYALVLLLQGLLIGFFTARDLALFVIFWEGMLLPLYFIINLWGGPTRQGAALKFLIYMIAGSSLMVVATLGLYFAVGMVHEGGSFNLDQLASLTPYIPHVSWFCAIFLLAFSVKTPLFPFHAWLPDTYYQASTGGTILLSALLSKAGIYGFIRIGVGLFPWLIEEWSPVLLALAITGVFYGGLAAWKQNDFKRLIAYSSFSHVNFILAGIFAWSQTAETGAILQAFNHGITITGLFLVAGWLEERLESTSMGVASGMAKFLPKLCWITLVFVLSSVALPSTNNFIGELLILFGLFRESPWLAALLSLTVILSVIYMLRWMQKMYFEESLPVQDRWIDITSKQMAIAFPLIVLIFWIGLYPASLLKYMNTVDQEKPNTQVKELQ